MKQPLLFFAFLALIFSFACNNKEEACDALPVAVFDADKTTGVAPLTVTFFNKSQNAASYKWDFGDGQSSTAEEPGNRVYTLPGTYVVKLIASGDGICGSETFTLTVTVLSQSVAKFQKAFGGDQNEVGLSVAQTTDGGYISLGYSNSQGAGGFDMYLVKTDNSANLVWTKAFGGANDDTGASVQQTTDGGYILLGYSASEGAGGGDVYLIKTDNNGNLVWKKTYGGVMDDGGSSVQQTTDGGYILLGTTTSQSAGQSDMYLIKTDNTGNLVWTRTYGGVNDDNGRSVQQTTDGGYVLLGTSIGASESDMYMIKTNNLGLVIWERTIGGVDNDSGHSVQQTSDGGYVLLGTTASEGAGANDMHLIKTDNTGNLVWKKTFGGADHDGGYSIRQTTDGGYVLLGYTASEGAGSTDAYLIKVDNAGSLLWKRTFGGVNYDRGNSIKQTSDGGYILLGATESFGAGGSDFYLVKTDQLGNAQ